MRARQVLKSVVCADLFILLVTMAFWLPLVFLLGNNGAWCMLVSTPGGSHPQDLQPIIADPAAYSNDWALQVEGGDEAADVLASFTGFINMGQVSRYRALKVAVGVAIVILFSFLDWES